MQNYKMVSANASVFKPIGVVKAATGSTTRTLYAHADTDEQVNEFANYVVNAYNNGIVGFRTCGISTDYSGREDFTGEHWVPEHVVLVDSAVISVTPAASLSNIYFMDTISGSVIGHLAIYTHTNGNKYIALINPN